MEIVACRLEAPSCLTRMEIRAVRPVSVASRDSMASSGSDSTLIQRISSDSAWRSSASVLPRPENRIFSRAKPAASARFGPASAGGQRLESAGMRLLFQLREDQKREVRTLARLIGLEKVASLI